MGETVLYERRGVLGYLTLNRPHRLNAMNDDLLIDLAAALRVAAADGEARVLVLRGAGRAFCAGADLEEITRLHTDVLKVLQMKDVGERLAVQGIDSASPGSRRSRR